VEVKRLKTGAAINAEAKVPHKKEKYPGAYKRTLRVDVE